MNVKHKKIVCLLLTLSLLVALLPVFSLDAQAASYPSLYPDQYEITVKQGETAQVKFTVFHEFKNEKAFALVHKGSRTGPVVASADHSFTNVYSGMSNWTLTWDTTNVEPGEYVVEYYMTFYSLYSWHETPNHSYLLKITVEALPCQNGHAYNAGVITTAPTCSTAGVKTFTCTVCGHKNTEAVPVLEHTWDAGVVTTAPTAVNGGVKTITCTKCKQTRTESLNAIFTDIPVGAYYAPAVDWAYETKITSGTTATTFSPESTCTRGQVVTFLWRASGSPEPTLAQNPFVDVAPSSYYFKAVLWAVENEITSGTTATTFSPDNTCSNAHILTFLWRSQGKPDFTGNGNWYDDAFTWANSNNLLEDTAVVGNIMGSCPRADVVTFLYRVLDKDASAALKHNYGPWTETTAPTCSKAGTKSRTCTDCGFVQTAAVAPTAHRLGAASCTQPAVCSVCGMTSGAAKGHAWSAATCTAAKTCSVCGATEGQALGHTTNNGTCTRCNTYISEPIVFTGTGDKIVTGVNLSKGLYKITLSYTGDSNFIVVPYDGDGDRNSSWVNEIGSYTGSVIFDESLTNGYLEVKASGPWTITIDTIHTTGTSNLAGQGDCVSPFFELPKGVQVVKMNYEGNSNFIVVVYDDTGRRYSSLANEIDSYSGEAIFQGGDPNRKYCIEVTASGKWSVDFGLTSTVTTCVPGK